VRSITGGAVFDFENDEGDIIILRARASPRAARSHKVIDDFLRRVMRDSSTHPVVAR